MAKVKVAVLNKMGDLERVEEVDAADARPGARRIVVPDDFDAGRGTMRYAGGAFVSTVNGPGGGW